MYVCIYLLGRMFSQPGTGFLLSLHNQLPQIMFKRQLSSTGLGKASKESSEYFLNQAH